MDHAVSINLLCNVCEEELRSEVDINNNNNLFIHPCKTCVQDIKNENFELYENFENIANQIRELFE